MGERSLISVVVPAWRAEKTLAATLDSILSQTWRELEVLVVDDASPDGTLALAQSYAAKEPRVRVIAQPQNGGDAAPTDPTVPAEPDAGYNTGAGEVVQIKGFRSIDIEWVSAVSIVISQCSRISSCAAR